VEALLGLSDLAGRLNQVQVDLGFSEYTDAQVGRIIDYLEETGQLENTIVVDVGGTSTDVGILVNGFPRESSIAVEIGGVRTNFRMPDIVSIALGGGTRVHQNGDLRVGPDSVGFRLPEEGLVFGGQTLTLTDVAVASGRAEIGKAGNVSSLEGDLVDQVSREIRNRRMNQKLNKPGTDKDRVVDTMG
jgi:N-methylhydantoinase A/oxoprolinase/acetone carboxylase beta subunit